MTNEHFQIYSSNYFNQFGFFFFQLSWRCLNLYSIFSVILLSRDTLCWTLSMSFCCGQIKFLWSHFNYIYLDSVFCLGQQSYTSTVMFKLQHCKSNTKIWYKSISLIRCTMNWHFILLFIYIIKQGSDCIVLSPFSHHLTDSCEQLANITV